MKIIIIIPAFNRPAETISCLRQLEQQDMSGHAVSVLVVDHGSEDDTSNAIKRLYPSVSILRESSDLWWSGAINAGIAYAAREAADAVVLLNDDLELQEDAFNELFKAVKAKPRAMISSIKLESDVEGDPIIVAGLRVSGFLNEIRNAYQGEKYVDLDLPGLMPMDVLTGSTLYIPMYVFKICGDFDADRFPHNWGDYEFSMRAKKAGVEQIVATRSITRTEYNKNYGRFFYRDATRRQYLENLLDVHRYSYGYRFLYRKSFCHRSMWKGALLYSRGFLSLSAKVVKKLLFAERVA